GACQFRPRSAWAAATSGNIWRRAGGAEAQPPMANVKPSRRRRTPAEASLLLFGLRRATLGSLLTIARLVQLLLHGLGGRTLWIDPQRALPRCDRLDGHAVLDIRGPQGSVENRIVLGEIDGALQLAESVRIPALLIVGPAQAVDEVPVLGLDGQRLLDHVDGLGEIDALLRVHVADVVVGLRVLGVDLEDAAERAHGVVEFLLLLVDHAELEVEILLLLVERQALLQDRDGAIVLRGALKRRAEIQEQLGPLGLEIDRLLEHLDRFVVPLGAAVQKPELNPRVDRSRIRLEDLFQLDPRLVLLACVDQRGRKSVARAEIRRIEQDGLTERSDRLVPVLLLVVDRTQLHPDPGIAGQRLCEALDLALGFGVSSVAYQEVAQSLDEHWVVRI